MPFINSPEYHSICATGFSMSVVVVCAVPKRKGTWQVPGSGTQHENGPAVQPRKAVHSMKMVLQCSPGKRCAA